MAARIRTRPLGPALVVSAVMSLLMVVAVAISTERSVAATPGPGPYDVAQVVDTNPDPDIVETDITAAATTLDVGNGVMANMWTYNGTVPGPQFRLKVGDTVIVHFKNLLPEATGIHWHGIEVPNASDGTPLTQNQVPTNGTFVYKFIVLRPGIFWYHPHHHASTNHVSRGLYGSMIITDDQDHESTLVGSGVLPGAAQTRTLVIADTTVCAAADSSTLCSDPIDHDGTHIGTPLAAGEIPNIQIASGGPVVEGRTVLTNGVNVGGRAGTPTSPGALDAGASKLDVKAGQGLRLQLVNAAAIRYFRLVLTDNAGAPVTLFRVGGEGGLLDEARVEGGIVSGYDTKYPSGEILLAPGDRADVVAAIPPSATGVLTLWTQGFARFGNSNTGPVTATVAHFNVNGSMSTPYTIANGTDLLIDPSVNAPVETLPAATSTLLDPSTFSPAKPGLGAQNIKLTNNQATATLGVDHIQGTHDALGDYTGIAHMGSARYAQVGDVLELTVTNETTPGAHHPFHLHGFSIQPISFTPWAGAPAPVPTASYTFPYHEFMDEIDIPGKYMLTFRVRLDDRAQMDGTTAGGAVGRWIFHCHLFHHATFGMVSELDVVAANGNERPYVNADATPVTANEGSTITTTGSWMDPDSDAVTLSASAGTVTKNAGGTWSWSYPVPAGAPEHVYITATDAGGKTDQAIFALAPDNNRCVVRGRPIGYEVDSRLEVWCHADAGTLFDHLEVHDAPNVVWHHGVARAVSLAPASGNAITANSTTIKFAAGQIKSTDLRRPINAYNSAKQAMFKGGTFITAVAPAACTSACTSATLSQKAVMTGGTAAAPISAKVEHTNSRTLDDVSCAAGSTVITSATAKWAATDIGKSVSGGPLADGTYITAVAGTTATLSQAHTNACSVAVAHPGDQITVGSATYSGGVAQAYNGDPMTLELSNSSIGGQGFTCTSGQKILAMTAAAKADTGGFVASDIGLAAVVKGNIGAAVTTTITAVTTTGNTSATLAANCPAAIGATAGLAAIGSAGAGAPGNNAPVMTLAGHLNVTPALVATEDDCNLNTYESFSAVGTWVNPGTAYAASSAMPKASVAQVNFTTSVLSFGGFVVPKRGGDGSDVNPHYNVSFPLLPTSVVACNSGGIPTNEMEITFGMNPTATAAAPFLPVGGGNVGDPPVRRLLPRTGSFSQRTEMIRNTSAVVAANTSPPCVIGPSTDPPSTTCGSG